MNQFLKIHREILYLLITLLIPSRIYLNKVPFLLLKPSFCLNWNSLPQREEHNIYWKMVFHTQNTESEEISCNGRVCIEVCAMHAYTQNQIVVKCFNGHNHENNPFIFHCSKVKTAIKRRASDAQDSTHNIPTSSLKKEHSVYICQTV